MSDITDEQWELLRGFIPAAKPGGRPRKVDLREIVNAIFDRLECWMSVATATS